MIARFAERFVGEGVELARGRVLFELAIPAVAVESGEPRPKLSHFPGRKPLDGPFDLKRAHFRILALAG